MNTRHIMAIACAAAFCCCVRAADTADAAVRAESPKTSISDHISIGAGVAVDSRYLCFGVVYNDDPIFRPSASITFFDWFSVGMESIFDMTPYGRKVIDGERTYTNRGGKYQELDPYAELAHAFSPEDCELLPTTVEFALAYIYEYHPQSMGRGKGSWGEPSQYISLAMALPDLWLEPTFTYHRDIDRDNGTYLNLELGHAFTLADGETGNDDPLVALRPSVAQGFGTAKRMGYYLPEADGSPLDHAGMMDTCIKLELTWNICEHVSLSGYVAYSDFLFDERVRHATRRAEPHGRWDESYNFYGGAAMNFTF